MGIPIRVLIVEDSEDDALLMVRELRRSGYEPTFERVDTPDGMRVALQDGRWEVIIADYSMPRFSALAALRVLREEGLDLPFIVVSGAIGEEVAVDMMRAGAHDYVMKDNLARLGPAIRRELHEAEERRARREAERALRESEAKLERARRMELLGVLAGGVAHDLNNLLGPLVAYPDLILMSLPPDSPIREDVLQMQQAAERAAAIVQDLLTLARRGAYQMGPLHLNAVIEQYLRSPSFAELRKRYPNVHVRTSLTPDALPIKGSVPHLTKVVMNLVTNAFEAMPEGGQLTVRTLCRNVERPLNGYERIEPGDYVLMEVEDTGVGIAPEDLGHIFEPFYTRKKMGRSGSGLGLAVVYGVLRDHKGRVDVRTTVGQGTVFTLYFPVTHEYVLEGGEECQHCYGHESVLVVDDLEEQRVLACKILSRLGYRVEAVGSGREALEYLSRHKVDILVLDMILDDEMDGLDVYREAIKIHPEQKAIIVSGFSETERVRKAKELGAGEFVKKPYTMEKIGQAVRRELDRSA